MALTITQVDDFKFALIDELECHLYDFVKQQSADIADVDGDYHAIRDELLSIQEGLTISFRWTAVGPLSRAFILIALLGIVQLHHLFMFPIKIKLENDCSLQVRSREAIDSDAAHGVYVIGEIAACEQIDDTEYTSSIGMSFRRDTVPTDVRSAKRIRINKERDEREVAKRKARDKWFFCPLNRGYLFSLFN